MRIYHAADDAPVSPKKLTVQVLRAVWAAGMVSDVLSVAMATDWRCGGLAAL